ncbi:glycosyltransferase [Methanococcoides orientis]|uniref:glycosyltransferase n=1 Tax=Methanococcoides orientis TaxID=2822137 RepID=UPI001E4E690E|nr:glycosyltransferase [Methanococcoides orientis]UGV40621.1 glycosyltransferase [Methanococcoides orientis]
MKYLTKSSAKDKNQIPKKGLIILMGTKASYSIVQSSRALHIFNEIKKHYPNTYLMLQKNELNEVLLENLVQIKPKIAIDGKLILLKGILFRLQMSLQIFHFLISKKIDYVLLRGYDTIILYPFLKLFNIKIYYDFHGRYDLELSQKKRFVRAFMVKLINKVIFKHSDKIIVISDGVKAQIEEYAHKCIYLPNGVDIEKIESIDTVNPINIPEDKKVIGFIGNWEQVMKIDDICDSVDYLRDVVVVIVGQGYQYNRIINKYGRKENVILTGRIEQNLAFSLLKRMDICIVPYDKNFYMSKIKNFFSNRKISEYLAAGKPMVIADIGGIPGYLKENINYIKYDSNNPQNLANKVEYLINNTRLYSQMSNDNRTLAKEFDWESIVTKSGLFDDL